MFQVSVKDPLGKEIKIDIHIVALNVGTMRGQSNEIVEILSRRLINISFVQESRWRVSQLANFC